MKKIIKIILSLGIILLVSMGITIPLVILRPNVSYLALQEFEVESFLRHDVTYNCTISHVNDSDFDMLYPKMDAHRWWTGEDVYKSSNQYKIYVTNNGTYVAIRNAWIFTRRLHLNQSYTFYGLLGKVAHKHTYILYLHRAQGI